MPQLGRAADRAAHAREAEMSGRRDGAKPRPAGAATFGAGGTGA